MIQVIIWHRVQMQLIDPFGERAQDPEGDVANYHMWPFILLHMHVIHVYLIHVYTYGHFDILHVISR